MFCHRPGFWSIYQHWSDKNSRVWSWSVEIWREHQHPHTSTCNDKCYNLNADFVVIKFKKRRRRLSRLLKPLSLKRFSRICSKWFLLTLISWASCQDTERLFCMENKNCFYRRMFVNIIGLLKLMIYFIKMLIA